MSSPKWLFDRELLSPRLDLKGLIGLDEVGRGCLAGPVVAGAAWVQRDFYERVELPEFVAGVKDSKQLNHQEREQVWQSFQGYRKNHDDVRFAWGLATVREIEQLNILGATKLAMQRALLRLQKHTGELEIADPCEVQKAAPQMELFGHFEHEVPTTRIPSGLLVDGKPLSRFPWKHHAVPKADDKSLAVGLASIGAKLVRDYHLIRLCKRWPGYGFARHKGYATPQHCQAILQIGITPVHRSLFCRSLLAQRAAAQ